MNARAARIADTAAESAEWSARLEADRNALSSCLPGRLVELHRVVTERAVAAGAASLILSGSTARARRTEISDLDYHLVGEPIDVRDLSRELDLHVLTPERLRSELIAGDDFVHWSLRFGLIVFDHGPAHDAVALIAERALWPNAQRKRANAAKSLSLARRFVATGDQDGALVQVRTALSLAARAHLLERGSFPLSRAELPVQLRDAQHVDAAVALQRCIHDTPSLPELARAVTTGEALLEPRTSAAS